MIQGMTGFGTREAKVKGLGKISVELRASNHKFLEIVFHLPEGLLFLEERLKKLIETKIKRGRITCVITNLGGEAAHVFINRALLKNYILKLKNIKEEFKIKDNLSMDTLIHLPGVLSLGENKVLKGKIWLHLEALVRQALEDLLKMRQKEGRALHGFLKNRAEFVRANLEMIALRFKKATKEKLNAITTDEERSSFLKDSDITEEIERLAFHVKNFKSKILKSGSIGKELDFIAQEMQREANTLAAKTFDASISGRIVQIKSQIEKIREQVQNIE